MASQEEESGGRSMSVTSDGFDSFQKEHGLHKGSGEPEEGHEPEDSNTIDLLLSAGASTSLRQVTAPERRTNHSTPLYASESGLQASTDKAKHRWVHHIPPDKVEIRVPLVERRWEYRTFDYDVRIAKVLEEIDEGNTISYMVQKKDNQEDEFTFEELINLPGGAQALRQFQKELSELEETDPEDSDTVMVATRRAQPRARKDNALFVDSSKMQLSGDDEPAPRRKGRPRGLLTQKPVNRSKSNLRSEDSESAHTSDTESSPHRPRKAPRPRIILRSTRSEANPKPSDDDGFLESSGSESTPARLGKRKRGAIAAGPMRKSDRSGRATKSMREILEDDIPEALTRTSSKSAPKVSGVNESFKSLPKTDDFRLRHCQNCDVCHEQGDNSEKGKLICCQGCTLSYHTHCLGPRNGREHLVTKTSEDDFVLQCRRCVEFVLKRDATAPHQSKCQECGKSGPSCAPFKERKTPREEQKEREENDGEDPVARVAPDLINNYKNVMFRCMSCYQAFHMHHLPSKSQSLMEPDNEDQKAAERFSWYCQDWACDDCLSAPGEIGGLVAWRPRDIESYTAGTVVYEVSEDDKEYLIKWSGKSFYRSKWKRGAWVWGMTYPSMRTAFARRDNGVNLPKMRTEDAIPEDYLRVDIVLEVKYNNVVSTRIQEVDLARIKEIASARVKFKGLGYEDVVWEEPPAPEDTERWADFKAAYEDWVRGHYIHTPSTTAMSSNTKKFKALDFESKIMLKEQPKSLKGGELMDYQIEGLNWLLYQWHRGQNAILADEMGLGKTIQVIAFVATLQEKYHCWPFLIVVPNSTCANWRREIKHWAPSLRVVTYFGSSKSRDLAFKHELFPENAKTTDLRCHVVVTSYDAAQDETCQRVFKKINWAALIVDEGQRLKNDKNILYNALSAVKIPFKVLLTGTPLQNNQRELFNLLQFLDTSVNAEDLEEKYAMLTKENVPELHTMLRPFFLRRTKAQVLTFLPPMAQIIVPVTMSALQKELYKSILAKNSDLIKSIFGGDRKTSVKGLRNILMQLRKCLCHPFVYSIAIEEKSAEAVVSHRRLVEASSKLQLLEIMLPKLKERGHRVLIFSQFLEMMTMVEDFLDGLALEHLRLDGSMGSLEKQKCIDAFNAPDSSVFAFILSTRAGGVGINLATADTVIILDPDFNPHQDIQAISRAHRIGQKKKVLIFQIMTRGSAEEKIVQIGKKKMALDHVLIEQMDDEEADGNDLESVLRFGAEALFNDDDTHDIHYDANSVNKLLDRSQIEDTKAGKDDSAESQFSFARVWQNDSATMEEGLATSEDDQGEDGAIWTKILAERARQADLEDRMRVETLGRGKRQRRNIDYNSNQAIADMNADDDIFNDENDTDFQARNESDEDDDESIPGEDPVPVDIDELKSPEISKRSRSKLVDPTPVKPPNFKRVDVSKLPKLLSPGLIPPPHVVPCLACKFERGPHAVGHCPLKLVGTELCNLCGLAHYGHGRSCPHLNSETQVTLMLNDLKNSPEDKALVDKAKKVLTGIKGSLVQQKRRREEQALADRTVNTLHKSGYEHGQADVKPGLKPNQYDASSNHILQSSTPQGEHKRHSYTAPHTSTPTLGGFVNPLAKYSTPVPQAIYKPLGIPWPSAGRQNDPIYIDNHRQAPAPVYSYPQQSMNPLQNAGCYQPQAQNRDRYVPQQQQQQPVQQRSDLEKKRHGEHRSKLDKERYGHHNSSQSSKHRDP